VTPVPQDQDPTTQPDPSRDPAEAAGDAYGDAYGDDVYQPAGSDAANQPSDPLDPENMLDVRPTEEPEEPGFSPPGRPTAVTRRRPTAGERQEGTPLDERLAEEQPDVSPVPGDDIGDLPEGEGEPLDEESGAVRAGRLVSPDPSVPGGVAAQDVGIDDGAASAEEAAVHRETAIDGGAA